MLNELSIRNFAIIDDLHIRFSRGLSVLSGETGAGKSIIVNAVNLLLGSRASADLIRTGADAAELEALFDISEKGETGQEMRAQGLDPSEGLLIRRIIARNDRHRVYINGRLATLQVLNSLTRNLASISGQHAHQQLLRPENHLLILDQFAGLTLLRDEIANDIAEMRPLVNRLEALEKRREQLQEQMALLKFQEQEIMQADPKPDEDARLENERRRLKHAETLFQSVHQAVETLYAVEGSAYERLAEANKLISDSARIDSELSEITTRLADAMFGIEDIVHGLRDYSSRIEIETDRLETVENRIDTLNRLKRKYGGSLDGVFERLKSIADAFAETENDSEAFSDTKKRIESMHGALCRKVAELSEKRRKTAVKLAAEVERELSTLKLGETRFEVSLETIPAPDRHPWYVTHEGAAITETGSERAAFLIAPNTGERLKPLTVIASGGELSRVVLALKAIVAKNESVQSVVFDEVDAGIGGGVAEVVGRKLSDLSRHHQIICITHLPQIAKFGNHHYHISKRTEQGRTQSTITRLTENQRVEEIARMLGGEVVTEKAREHAREMMLEIP